MEDIDYNLALAENFMGNTLAIKPGENCWIEYSGVVGTGLAEACAEIVTMRGGQPYMVDRSSGSFTKKFAAMDAAALEDFSRQQLKLMKTMQAYIRICDDDDESKIDVTAAQMAAYNSARKPARDYRVSSTRWLVVDSPTMEAAERSRMPYDEYRDFYFKVNTANHGAIVEPVKPLQRLLTTGRHVRIYNPANGTDLTLTLCGAEAVPCTGTHNLPDGECFTAPELYSINGVIEFGPSFYDGQAFKFIRLHFENGRVTEAEAETAERTERLNYILDTDERNGAQGWGGRYVGEFSFDFNPFIDRLTGSILFDEKVNDGIHMALGSCYDEADNGNKESEIHWDMIHRGGQIWIDGVLIRNNGLFVPPDFQGLNPENLKAAMERPKPPGAGMQRQP